MTGRRIAEEELKIRVDLDGQLINEECAPRVSGAEIVDLKFRSAVNAESEIG